MTRGGALTVREALDMGRTLLGSDSFEDPALEARAILGGLLNYSTALLQIHGSRPLSQDIEKKYRLFLKRRRQKEPVAYLLEKKNFFGRDFFVSPSVLIPRPETELVVEEALDLLGHHTGPLNVLEVGTGSGCIAITLALTMKNARITAMDTSSEALSVARDNAEKLQASDQISFIRSNVYEGLRPENKGDFDMIISNPPYVLSSQLSSLDPDLSYEPRQALDGGEDGLKVLRPLVRDARMFLKPTGFLILEIGFDLGDQVKRLMEEAGFGSVKIIKDFSGLDRIAIGEIIGSV